MASVPPQPLGPRDLFVVALVNIVWGLNIIAVKMSVEATTPFTAAAMRQWIVLAVCGAALRWVPGRMAALLLLGVLNGAVFLTLVNLSLILSANVSALAIAGQMGVPFSLILSILFLGERIRLPRLMGIVLAFGGVAVLAFDPAAAKELPGIALSALAAMVWGFGTLIQRRLAGVSVLTIYAWVGLIGAVILTAGAGWFEPQSMRSVPAMRVADLGWIAFSAIGSTAIGQGGMAWLLQRHPVSTVAPLTLASPVVAVATSSWFFGTALTPAIVLGAAMAILGVAIITVRSARAERIEGEVV